MRELYDRSARRAQATGLADGSRDAPPDGHAGPAEVLISLEEEAALEYGLRTVPEREREALLLRLELCCPFAAIAAECGYPSENAARMAVARSGRKVHAAMSRFIGERRSPTV